MNSKLRLAKTISTLTNPPIICIPLFIIICLTLSIDNLWQFPVLEMISLIFASILPMAIILYWAKKTGNDRDISRRQDRFTPLIVGTVSYFIGFLVSIFLGLNDFLTFLFLCYTINTFIVMLITTRWIDHSFGTCRCSLWTHISCFDMVKSHSQKAYHGSGYCWRCSGIYFNCS